MAKSDLHIPTTRAYTLKLSGEGNWRETLASTNHFGRGWPVRGAPLDEGVLVRLSIGAFLGLARDLIS